MYLYLSIHNLYLGGSDIIISTLFVISHEYPGYDTKLHLMVRLQSWSYVEFDVHFHCHYSQVHLDPGQ